jgi:hypothetical protein
MLDGSEIELAAAEGNTTVLILWATWYFEH